jgi:glycosyltransferase involved in cell wall biosynthesis
MYKMPDFSIVIPTYNRREPLETTLKGLVDLAFAPDRFEVIVADDGSARPVDRLLDAYKQKLTIRLFRQTNAGPATARNNGAMQARGQYLAFIDDDCIPAPDWLANLAVNFRATPEAMIGGHTINALSGNPYAAASQSLIDYIYQYNNADPEQARFFTSNNMAVPATGFQRLGGFDTSFPLAAGEDREFCERWRRHGLQMRYAAEVRVYHLHAMTLRSFWQQHFNYGRGAFHVHQRRLNQAQPEAGKGLFTPEPLSFYLKLMGYPLAQNRGAGAIQQLGLVGISQLATAAGVWRERLGHSPARGGNGATPPDPSQDSP